MSISCCLRGKGICKNIASAFSNIFKIHILARENDWEAKKSIPGLWKAKWTI